MTKKALIAIADGSEDLETVTMIDVLRRAEIEVTVASVQELKVTCSRGTKLEADTTIGHCLNNQYDLVAIPGGLPGADNLRQSGKLKELLLKQRDSNRYHAAICAAPALVFKPHGLLESKKATCYPAFSEKLENSFSDSSTVIVDGFCVTSQGPGTALDFSLKLVELLVGKEKAQEIAEAMLYEYSQ